MSAIAKFYSGRSVLVTGGIGFIGKQLVEKLLRSCSDVDTIYLLVRPKKDTEINQRLSAALSTPVFERLSQSHPKFHEKLVPILGDVSQDSLGISANDQRLLADRVSIVFHAAAMLHMMESLKKTVNANVLGVRRMLTLCKQLPKLDALVHISTAYSQVDKKNIDEKIYDPPIEPERLIAMTQELNDEELMLLAAQLCAKSHRPNNYALTKAVAEHLIFQERGKLPVCIVRPSIVGATLDEPMKGWIDNYTGLTGMYAGVGTGLLQCALTTGSICVDTVPVDLTANAIIVAGWNTATQRQSGLPVYNFTSEGLNRTTIQSTGKNIVAAIRKHPFKKIPGKRSLLITQNKYVYQYYSKLVVPLQCQVIDLLLRLAGKKPSMVKLHEQSSKLQNVLLYFTTNEWHWSNDNLLKMQDRLNEVDKKEFNYDVKKINWSEYFEDYWLGVKKYLLEPADSEKKPAASATTKVQPIPEKAKVRI